MTLPSAILFLAFAVLSAAAFFFFSLRVRRENRAISDKFQEQFSSLENRLRENTEHFVQSANDRFINEQTKSIALLEQNKQSLESQFGTLNTQLGRITGLIQEFEKTGARNMGSLEEQIAQSVRATGTLAVEAQKLRAVMGNNQLRGQWGQKMAEDILRAAGLEEGIHYSKDKSQETLSTRPDFTFFLPDDHKVCMDVKFPLNNYEAMIVAEEKSDQDRYAAEFIKDVKNRIRELKKREYINKAEQTLDYIILFIPNEQVFGFIHRWSQSDIMTEALSEKVILTSPYSLFGVLSIIRQSYENFHFQRTRDEVLKLISTFAEDYENFKKRFEDLGQSIDKTRDKYFEVSEKSFKRMDLRFRKIEDFKRGQTAETEFLLQ